MDPIRISLATGEEPFLRNGTANGLKLLDFWAWAYSDYVDNAARGVLAEFLVAAALGLDLRKPREGWARFDLTYRNVGVEVKSASYHQRWHQKRMSAISYKIPATRGWDEATNIQEKEAKRQAFMYVLCLLSEKQREKVDPLNVDQWLFWAVPTRFFNERARSQHSITYNSLIREVGAPVPYGEIRPLADRLIDEG